MFHEAKCGRVGRRLVAASCRMASKERGCGLRKSGLSDNLRTQSDFGTLSGRSPARKMAGWSRTAYGRWFLGGAEQFDHPSDSRAA